MPPTFADLADDREKFVCNQMPITYPKYKYQKHLPSFEDINQRSTDEKYKLQTDLIEKKLAELKARELELEAKSGRALKQLTNNEPELVENSPILIISNSVEGHHEQNRGHDQETKSAGELKEYIEQRRTQFERLDGLATFRDVRKSYDHEPPHSIL
jgi:transketolase